MRQIQGSRLRPSVQAEALRRFIHRYTKDHTPNWASLTPGLYPVQFASDEEWLACTKFHVTLDGSLSPRHGYCESSPTWPDNPELRKVLRNTVHTASVP